MAIHFGNKKDLWASITIRYAMHIKKLITIAENPRIIIRSLKNGTADTISLPPVTVFLASILPKKINSRNEMLHIKVNFEKNEINFINKMFWKYSRQNNINLVE